MGMYHARPTVADLRARKTAGDKLTMLFVETEDEARAAAEAGIDMLSVVAPLWTPAMRAAAGDCFVQVGLLYGALCTGEDYLRAAHAAMQTGADCVYCAASLDIQKLLCDNAIPVVAHVGLIPSQCTWTGGFRAVGKTAAGARAVWDHVKRLEEIGCFGAELEVVPDRVARMIAENTPLLLLGMGAGAHADAQYLFAEDVLGHGVNKRPRHAKTYRNFAAEFERLQRERVAAFGEFIADVKSGDYPGPEHAVSISDEEFESFLSELGR